MEEGIHQTQEALKTTPGSSTRSRAEKIVQSIINTKVSVSAYHSLVPSP